MNLRSDWKTLWAQADSFKRMSNAKDLRYLLRKYAVDKQGNRVLLTGKKKPELSAMWRKVISNTGFYNYIGEATEDILELTINNNSTLAKYLKHRNKYHHNPKLYTVDPDAEHMLKVYGLLTPRGLVSRIGIKLLSGKDATVAVPSKNIRDKVSFLRYKKQIARN